MKLILLTLITLTATACGNPMQGAHGPAVQSWSRPAIKFYAANCSNAAYASTYWCQVPKTTTTTPGTVH